MHVEDIGTKLKVRPIIEKTRVITQLASLLERGDKSYNDAVKMRIFVSKIGAGDLYKAVEKVNI